MRLSIGPCTWVFEAENFVFCRQMVWFREGWPEEVLRQLRQGLIKCYQVAFETRSDGKFLRLLHFLKRWEQIPFNQLDACTKDWNFWWSRLRSLFLYLLWFELLKQFRSSNSCSCPNHTTHTELCEEISQHIRNRIWIGLECIKHFFISCIWVLGEKGPSHGSRSSISEAEGTVRCWFRLHVSSGKNKYILVLGDT